MLLSNWVTHRKTLLSRWPDAHPRFAVLGLLSTGGLRGWAWRPARSVSSRRCSRPCSAGTYVLCGVLLLVWLIGIAFVCWTLGAQTLRNRQLEAVEAMEPAQP